MKDRLMFLIVAGILTLIIAISIRDKIASSNLAACLSVSEHFQADCRLDQLLRRRERDREFPGDAGDDAR